MSQNTSPLVGRGAWWGDRTVKTKILATVAVSAVATGVVGFMGLQALSNAAASADSMYTSHTKGVDTAADISSAVANIALNARDTILATGPKDAATDVAALDGLGAEFDQAVGAYEATDLDATNKPVLDELVSTMTTYRAYLKNTLAPIAVAGHLQQWVVENDAHGPAMTDVLDKDAQTLRDIELTAAARQDAQVRAAYQSQRTASIVLMLVGILAAVGLGLVVAVGIARAARKVQAVAEALAAGDLTKASGVTSATRSAGWAASLDAAVESMRELMSLGGRVGGRRGCVVGGAVARRSAQISASAEETSAQSGVVSAAAEEVSRNVQTVAAGAEQMGASIREIASNAAEACEVAARAVTAAETTTATVAKLGDSSAEIGNVVKVITSHRRADEPAGAERHDRGRPGR